MCVSVLFFIAVVVENRKKKNHSSEFLFQLLVQLLLYLIKLPNFMLNSFSPNAAANAASTATATATDDCCCGYHSKFDMVCVCMASMVFIVLLISNRLIEHRLSHDDIHSLSIYLSGFSLSLSWCFYW